MASVRIDDRTHAILQLLSNETGRPTTELIGRAVENFRRAYILSATNNDYATLRTDPQAWAEEEAERSLRDVTLADGLESEP